MSAMEYAGSETVGPSYGLHHYQRKVVADALSMLGEGRRRTVIHMPTGAGKTRVACHIACHLLKQSESEGKLVVWLASTEELCAQAAEDLARAWSSLGDREIQVHGAWGDSDINLAVLDSGFLVAGMQKLYAASGRDVTLMRTLAEKTAGVIFDEAHQAVALTYRYLTEQLTTYHPPLIGLTATPGRTSEVGESDYNLASLFGGNKVTIDPRGHGDPVTYLIRQGFLAEPRFEAIRLHSQVGVAEPEDAMDYTQTDLARVGENDEWRDRIVGTTIDALRTVKRVLVFAPSVESAKEYALETRRNGMYATTVLGGTPREERSETIARFRSNEGEPMALFNYGVLTAGFDAPRTRCVIVARPTTSLVLYSQMCGRAMRGPRSGGNRTCRIYTVVDTDLPGFGSVAEAFANWETLWKQA